MSSSDTVVIGCKLPNGLLIRVFEWIDGNEATPGGSRKLKVARQLPQVFEVKGSAIDRTKAPSHIITDTGAALTPGCPRELWEKWLDQNKGSDLINNGLIFAYDDINGARDMAAERERERTGIEPVNPEGDPRAPKSIKKGSKKADDE